MLQRNVPVLARDGCRLLSDVYTASEGGSRPTLIHRTIYNKSDQLAGKSVNLHGLLDAGFNVVVQDLRGCHGSDGVFEPYMDDSADTSDTLDWIRSQPWSSSAVGLIGRSYAGFTQWQASTSGERITFDAFAPEGCSATPYEGWTYRGGVFRLGFSTSWFISDLLQLQTTCHPPQSVRDALCKTLEDPVADLPSDVDEWIRVFAPYVNEWRNQVRWERHWKNKDAASRISKISAPALCINGWRDPFVDCTLRDFTNVACTALPEARLQSRLVIGPWSHTGSRVVGDAPDLTALHIAWFKRHLLRAPSIEEGTRVRVYIMGSGQWLNLSTWPPNSRLRPKTLFLSEGIAGGTGALRAESPAPGSRPVQLRAAWSDPVLTGTEGRSYFAQERPENISAKPTSNLTRKIARYVSAAMTSPTVLLGEIRGVLWVESSASCFDVAVKLERLAVDGKVDTLADGIKRVRQRRRGFVRVDVSLGAVGQLLQVGDRLRLELSGSNFPEYDVNRSTSSCEMVQLSVGQTAGAASYISVPRYQEDELEGVVA